MAHIRVHVARTHPCQAGGRPFGKPAASAVAHNPRDFSVPQKPGRGKIMTQHTGLPPRATGLKTGAKSTAKTTTGNRTRPVGIKKK